MIQLKIYGIRKTFITVNMIGRRQTAISIANRNGKIYEKPI